jgi:outer membrane protein with beta-barrel domain
MLRTTLMLASALSLMLATVQAHAGNWIMGLNGGVAAPRSDFERRAALGLIGGVDLDYLATPHLALGFDGSFVRFREREMPYGDPGTLMTAKSSMLQVGGHLKYIVTQRAVSPMVLVGVGAYRFKDGIESPDPYYDSEGRYETFFGTRAGLGMMCKTSEKVSIGAEAALHAVWTIFSWADFEARQFIGVQTGVYVNMGGPAE